MKRYIDIIENVTGLTGMTENNNTQRRDNIMKKRFFGIFLAAALLLSSAAYANPAAVVTENADETQISVSELTADFAEETAADFDAPVYGVKVINEDFESYSDYTSNLNEPSKYIVLGDNVATVKGGYSKLRLKTDGDGNNYFRVEFQGQYPSLFNDFSATSYTFPEKAKYTFVADVRVADATALSSVGALKMQARYNSNTNKTYTAIVPKSTWTSMKAEFSTPYEVNGTSYTALDRVTFSVERSASDASSNGLDIDNMKLYYKPVESAGDYTVDINFPAVTIKAPTGVEKSAAFAIEQKPQSYFGAAANFIKSAVFSDDYKTLTLTFDENAGSQTLTLSVPGLVNADKSAVYNAKSVELDTADVNTLKYGAKIFSENFDSYTQSGQVQGLIGIDDIGLVWKSSNAKINLVNESDGHAQFARLGIGGTYANMQGVLSGDKLSLPEAATYTLISDQRAAKGAATGRIKHQFSYVWGKTMITGAVDNGSTDWFTMKSTFKTPYEGYSVPDRIVFQLENAAFAPNYAWYVDYDNIFLYCKPAVEDENVSFEIGGDNIAAVTYADGIDADTAKALTTCFKTVFGGDVTALTIDENTVNLTFADGVRSIEMPEIVNSARSATYPAITVCTAKPETSEDVNYSEIYSGIRFQASVTAVQRGKASEYGWIVARKTVLDGRELTFALDNSTGKTYVYAVSYGTVDGNHIDKFISNTDDIVYTGIVTGIPQEHTGDILVARPYIKYNGSDTVYYGNAREASVDQVKALISGGNR